MPKNFVLQQDNTVREGRNQHMMTWLAMNVGRDILKGSSALFQEPGHTHNEADQRFSVINTALGKAVVLQTPEAL